jgi:hypothetical protein
MDAVSRLATIAAASESLGEDSLLRALAQEVRELRTTMANTASGQAYRRARHQILTIKRLLRGKVFRKELYPYFLSQGGTVQAWAQLLRMPIPQDSLEEYAGWGFEEWKEYVAVRAKNPLISERPVPESVETAISEEVLSKVRELLPPRPWPTGIHRDVAGRLDISEKLASRYIRELLRRGEFAVLGVEPTQRGEETDG